MSEDRIGVIGAGTMGTGVALDLIFHQIPFILVDVSDEVLEKAKNEIVRTARFAHLLGGGWSSLSAKQIEMYLVTTTKMQELDKCTFIIENIREDKAAKRALYGELDTILGNEVCIGANTSCISITSIASGLKYRGNVVGMHLMNPVYLKRTVELIRGHYTTEECLRVAKGFLSKLEKKAIVVNDYPGFVSNRISHLFMNEAAFVVQDQVATPKQVDEIFEKCYEHSMGPLKTADMIGLDTVVDSLRVLYESYQDPKFRVCPLLQKMVDAGLLGCKTKQGFYQY